MSIQKDRALKTMAMATLLGGLLLTGCSSLDCPYNNLVYTKYRLRGDVTTLADTLTITTSRTSDGRDTILLNQAVNTDSFELPMSYSGDRDILRFHLGSADGETFDDTVTVKKENYPHFESVDCSPAFFHIITGVSYTTHAIDSIVLHQPQVTYNATQPHFYIYFRYRD